MPYLVRDPNQLAGGPWLVVALTFCGVEAVSRQVFMPGVSWAVRRRIITDWELARWPHLPWTEETSLHSFLEELKKEAVTHGAEAGAVQLIRGVSPFTEEELNIMVAKLKTKGAAKAPAKKPADKPKGAAKGAAAAATERANANHAKKIKLLVKPADAGLRGGRLAKLQAIADNKPATVGDIVGTVVKDEGGKEHKIDMGSLTAMVKRGHVAIA